jgi:cell fate (sporulation/competence/biofilm development) regulator YlbF (YheA/YmcA/DUF963 family)
MTTQNMMIDGNLGTAVNTLAVNIQYTEPVNRFLTAREKFDQDPTARKIMEELSEHQREIRQKQTSISISADDLEKLRSLQVKAQENKAISTFAFAQQEAIGYLREINTEISNLLGIDFASLAKNTNCC